MSMPAALRASLNSAPEKGRSVCTFCRMGCELEVIRQGWRVAGVEYPADAPVNQGRLCPRGSASALLLDHPRRLAYPLRDGKERTWPEFFSEVGPRLRNLPSNELAITYDGNLTREELGVVYGFANRLGTENVASAYLESEACFALKLDVKDGSGALATLADVQQADTILVVGDAFAKMPVLAKPVLDARYAGRERRLYCIDSVKTVAAGFSHRAPRVKPGTESLALLALAGLVDSRLKGFDCESAAAACGISPADLREIAAGFGKPKRGVVIAAIHSGRTADPALFSLALQLLVSRMKGNKRLLMAAEAAVPPGPRRFSEILGAIESREVKTLVNFGGSLPWDDPGISEPLKKLDLLVAMATMKPEHSTPGWVLPVPMNLEKAGTVDTVWGTERLQPAVSPASGVRAVPEIVDGLLDERVEPDDVPELPDVLRIATKTVTDLGRAMLKSGVRSQGAGVPEPQDSHPFLLQAEQPAYDFRGIFSQVAHPVLMARADAQRLGVVNGDRVMLGTRAGTKLELAVACSDRAADGTLLVNAARPEVWALFVSEVDKLAGIVTIPPVRARVWRSE
jgi:anaerobic selenocysteine-containing dehydrogenase